MTVVPSLARIPNFYHARVNLRQRQKMINNPFHLGHLNVDTRGVLSFRAMLFSIKLHANSKKTSAIRRTNWPSMTFNLLIPWVTGLFGVRFQINLHDGFYYFLSYCVCGPRSVVRISSEPVPAHSGGWGDEPILAKVDKSSTTFGLLTQHYVHNHRITYRIINIYLLQCLMYCIKI